MTALAVTHEVEHDVTLELLTVVDGDLSGVQHGVRIISIDVDDRRLNHLGDVGAVFGRASVIGTRGGEAHLVVDDDMHGTARLVGTGLRHLEGFHDHALTGEGRVTVDGNRQYAVTLGVFTTVLTGTHGAFHHRRDDLQVRRVERQRQVDFAARRHDVRAEALVVLHVAGTLGDLLLAVEFLDQLGRALAQQVDQQVETATVGHADHDFLGTVLAAALDQLIHHRNEGFAAFQTKALGARVLAGEIALEAFGGGQTFQHVMTDIA